MKILAGAAVEHWLDKREREHKPIACPGNYIRIPADALVKMQEIRNKGQKELSLFEQQKRWEEERAGEVLSEEISKWTKLNI